MTKYKEIFNMFTMLAYEVNATKPNTDERSSILEEIARLRKAVRLFKPDLEIEMRYWKGSIETFTMEYIEKDITRTKHTYKYKLYLKSMDKITYIDGEEI